MKRYLDLIPISARVHKKQSKMTRVCIILAVFLVTAIFSMADMEIRSQYLQTIKSDGNWHAMFKEITEEQAESIAAAPEVEAASWYDVLNYRLDEAYEIDGNRVAICGFEEDFYELMPAAEIVEGESFADAMTTQVNKEKGISTVLTLNAKEKLHVQVGNNVMLTMPDGRAQQLRISGFTKDTGMIMKDDAIGVFVDIPTIALLKGNADHEEMAYYVQFSRTSNIPKVITRIENELGLTKEQVGRNEKLLGVMGMSRDSYILQLYGVAAVLAILVITAGVLMIAGNLNSNVAKRTEFFGMMRCQGATKAQIKRFVRLEALNWCKSAVPEGVAGGIAVTWILCNMLRLASPGYFSEMPAFGISTMGILFGIVIGVITVLIGASAPAKRAAAVSPLTAVSGNSYYSETEGSSSRKSKTKKIHAIKVSKNARKIGRVEILKKSPIRISKFLHVETSLGIHHACGSKKNYFLMAGSFAFSIILFLAFTTAIDFLGHALSPVQPYTPDLSVISSDNTCSIESKVMEEISQSAGVKRVYGRMFAYALLARIGDQDMQINLISYEDNQFRWAKDDLTEGQLRDVINGSAVLTVYDMNNPLQAGDTIQTTIAGKEQELQIAGVLSDCPFHREEGIETMICSEETFRRLTGENGYTILDIQLGRKATDADVASIRKLAGDDVQFSDQRMSNSDVRGAYYSMSIFIYGFLIIIALISVFNIVNSIAMSVSARLGQYGAMRAIGMSDRQVIRMVGAEALTYSVSGVAFGCLLGLPINKALFSSMITFRWGDAWQLPIGSMLVIILTVSAATILAIYGPAKQIREMTIVDTIRGE